MNIKEILNGKVPEADLAKIELVFNKSVEKKVASRLNEELDSINAKTKETILQQVKLLTESRMEKYKNRCNEEMEGFKSEILTRFDTYLQSSVPQMITEELGEGALEKICKYEVLNSLNEGIMDLYSKKYRPLESNDQGAMASKIEKQEAKIKELSEELAETKSLRNKLGKKLLIEQKTEGLSDKSKKKALLLCEGLTLEQIAKKLPKVVKMLNEDEGSELEDETAEEIDDDELSADPVGDGDVEGDEFAEDEENIEETDIDEDSEDMDIDWEDIEDADEAYDFIEDKIDEFKEEFQDDDDFEDFELDFEDEDEEGGDLTDDDDFEAGEEEGEEDFEDDEDFGEEEEEFTEDDGEDFEEAELEADETEEEV